MIDVVIPAYNSHETIEYTLMSIAMQNIVKKLNVYIIDDNSKSNYNHIAKKFSNMMNITLIKLNKNIGPAKTRQYAIDISKSKYITFIDSDDLLKNPESLELLYNEIEKGYDYVCSKTYYEENDSVYINNGDLHGKIYSREFIKNNNIHFFESRYHEDNAFNNLILINNPKSSIINDVTYIYSLNKNSVTHNPFKNEMDSIEIYIQTVKNVIDKATNDCCSKNMILEYIKQKENYLNYIYKDLNETNKNKLISFIYKYNLNEYIKIKE